MARLYPVELQAAGEYLEAQREPVEGEKRRAPAGPMCKVDGCGRPTNPEHEGYCLSHLRRYKMFGVTLAPPE